MSRIARRVFFLRPSFPAVATHVADAVADAVSDSIPVLEVSLSRSECIEKKAVPRGTDGSWIIMIILIIEMIIDENHDNDKMRATSDHASVMTP